MVYAVINVKLPQFKSGQVSVVLVLQMTPHLMLSFATRSHQIFTIAHLIYTLPLLKDFHPKHAYTNSQTYVHIQDCIGSQPVIPHKSFKHSLWRLMMQMASNCEELECIKDLLPKRRESKKLFNKHDLEFLFVSHFSPALLYIGSSFLTDTLTISLFFWMVFWIPSFIK